MTAADDITRLAWAGKIIRELAALTCLRVSDEHFDAEVLPREAVMDAVCKIRDATREGEAVIRALAQQGKAGGVLGWVRPTDAAKIKDLRSGALGLYTSAQQDDIYTMPIYATPPANPPEAGVTDALFEIVEEAFREGFASPATYNDAAENTPDESWEQKREYFRKRFRKAAALTAPQPKGAGR